MFCSNLACFLNIYALKEEAEPPEAKELVRLCDSSYCASDFKHMEVILLDRWQIRWG